VLPPRSNWQNLAGRMHRREEQGRSLRSRGGGSPYLPGWRPPWHRRV